MFCSNSNCTDSLQVLPGSPSGTSPTSLNGTCDVSNVNVEGDFDMQGEEEVNVKTEEEECIDIKQEDGIYIEEKGEEDIDTTEDDVVIKEESCTDPLQVLPGSSSETFPTPSDVTCDVSNTAVQQDVVVEENFIAVSKEAPIGIKQEEIPEDISFPDIKAEPDESCTDSLHILPGSSSDTFPSPSDGTCDVSNTAVQQDVVVIEERFIAVNEEAHTGIKQEEIPEDISFPDIKTEPYDNCVDLRSGELGFCATSSEVGNEVIRVHLEGISVVTEEENQEAMTSSLIRTSWGYWE